MKYITTHSSHCITFIALLCITFFSITSQAQNTSPVYVVEFNKIQNGIMDEGKLQKNQLEDYDNNPVCLVKVKAQGFDEATLQKLVFVPRNIMIMHKAYENGEYRLYVSSKKPGSILMKYQGECEFRLPYNLEPKKIYELVLGMETATLNIITTPDNATIYIDGEKVGIGYGSKAVSIGAEHRYKVECENYITEESSVTFTQSEKKELNIELRPDFGYITVKSTPGGAEVYVDEKKAGTTPYQMKKIKRGQHVVELRMTGYEPFADMVTIKAGEVNKQFENVVLEAVRVATGTIVLESNPSGAVVTIDGRQYGQTPKTLTEFPVGAYTVYFTKEGYQNLAQHLDLKDGGRETLSVTMSKTSAPQQPVAQQVVQQQPVPQQPAPTVTTGASGGSATGNKTNGHEYVDLGLPSGTLWATCNIGANKPEDYGDYYAWGETTTKSTYKWNTYKWCRGSYDSQTKYCTESSYGIVDNRTVLEMSDDAAHANWGGDWRMPTTEEWKELKDRCTWTWTTQGGKNGYRVTGPNGKSISLPAAGYRSGTSLNFAGSFGNYWSSSLLSSNPSYAYVMVFNSGDVRPQDGSSRYGGFSVRPVRPAR